MLRYLAIIICFTFCSLHAFTCEIKNYRGRAPVGLYECEDVCFSLYQDAKKNKTVVADFQAYNFDLSLFKNLGKRGNSIVGHREDRVQINRDSIRILKSAHFDFTHKGRSYYFEAILKTKALNLSIEHYIEGRAENLLNLRCIKVINN